MPLETALQRGDFTFMENAKTMGTMSEYEDYQPFTVSTSATPCKIDGLTNGSLSFEGWPSEIVAKLLRLLPDTEMEVDVTFKVLWK